MRTVRLLRRVLTAAWLAFSLCHPSGRASAESPEAGAGAIAEVEPPAAEFVAPRDQPAATLRLYNRKIAEFRAPFLGSSPSERVLLASRRFFEVLERDGPGEVSTAQAPQGVMVSLDGAYVFILTPGDAELLAGETASGLAAAAARSLRTVVSETREARDVRRMSFAALKAAIASGVYALLLLLFFMLRRRVAARMSAAAERKSGRLRVFGMQLFDPNSVRSAFRWLMSAALSGLAALLSYEWLTYLLGCFPYTRAFSERLHTFLLSTLQGIVTGSLGALPGLSVALAIFMVAYVVVSASNGLFMRIQRGSIALSWLDADTAKPTRRLVSFAVWVFALVMAYPYLPGSDTQAFKGISVLLGLMVSLGGSSMVAHAGSGLILMYIRAYRSGEYVSIAGHEGTITELGTFATRIRTGLGEEVLLPNAIVIGSSIKNYSRAVQGHGFILDTSVTIGYDTPWRQVEAMLLAAAERTQGILSNPAPRVFQVALADFYIEYRLVTQAIPSEPLPRAAVLSDLHRNIQDVFNEHGVQIMSPHYALDPKRPKVVPPADWHAAPAKPPLRGPV